MTGYGASRGNVVGPSIVTESCADDELLESVRNLDQVDGWRVHLGSLLVRLVELRARRLLSFSQGRDAKFIKLTRRIVLVVKSFETLDVIF